MGNRSDGPTGRSRPWLRAWVFALALGLATTLSNPASAQEGACAPAIGRLVSLQGSVEVQRAGSQSWIPVQRLDTSLCGGDRLRTGTLSRAAFFVQPETLVRLDQNTTITLNQTNEEIEVEFFAAELAANAKNAQSFGAGYFITRFPKKFKIKTPHVNAAVEGTEFMVELGREATQLTVIEGKVSSESVASGDTQIVTAGQSLASGTAGAGSIVTVVKPQDAVQWVLRYPPLSDGSIATMRAEELLQAGSVDEALAAIDEALNANPANADALASRAVIQIAKNDKAGALESANRATTSDASNFRGWLALSYAQQASFDLDAALGSALKAESLQSRSSLAHARVAELYLSLGDPRRAEAAAHAAIVANPAESHAYSMLGFVHLAQIETQAARADFESAIERDSFSAMPRLGLGLAMIREGELIHGREQLEIAVALDPSNSLLRSYVGKAYYEENTRARDELATTQFELARQLDPQDPTPWYYEAVLKDSQSRAADALESLDRSTALNNDRAVYRSRQLLDLDLAARGTSQASVYNELGFHQLGLQEAAKSLAVDPASGSAHRFMADIYSTLPRHDIARASELLQSQLRQPLGAAPIQAQLANDVLFRNTFFGPASVGLNEFNPLFTRAGIDFQFFGLLGSNDTIGDQAIVNGLSDRFSFSVSQFAADTDGHRPNNDDRQRQYNGFLQWQPAAATSVQLEVTRSTRDFGDLSSAFDPDFFSDVDRNEEELDAQRIGLRQVIGPQSDILVSVIRQDRHASLDFSVPGFPGSISNDEESLKSEFQYLMSGRNLKLIVGGSYFDSENREEVNIPPFSFANEFKPHHLNAYGYVYLAARDNLPQIQVGLSYDYLSSDVGKQSQVNPKVGVIWNMSDSVTLRGSGFRVLSRRLNSDQGLEPTQLAGFNQLFDDRTGTSSESGGLAGDFKLSPSVFAGLQIERRSLDVPSFDTTTGEIIFQNQREELVSGYVYWLPIEVIAVSFEPRYHDFEHGTAFATMTLTELPISVKFMSPSGLWIGVSVTGVEQSGRFDVGGDIVAGSDNFWLINAIAAYRLPGRRGTISLEGTNLFDQEFEFQEIDFGVQPRYLPEAQVFLRVSLSF